MSEPRNLRRWTRVPLMEVMRDILRGSFGRSLKSLRDEDRVAAAWTIACGRVLAGRGVVVGFSQGVIQVEVADGTWMRQLKSMQTHLEREIARIANVQISGIHFEVK